MSGIPKILIVPCSVDGKTVPPTRFGVLVRQTPEGGFIVREGYGEQLNWVWHKATETLAHQLLCGPTLRSTGVTLDGISAGTLDQLLRVVRRVQPPGNGGTRTRGPELVLTPSGLLVIAGAGLLDTPEGLGRLDMLFTSGGYPRTEYAHDGQAGLVPLGVHAHLGRFSTVATDGPDGFLSMPIRFDAGAPKVKGRVPSGGGVGGPFQVRDRNGGTNHDSPGPFTVYLGGAAVQTATTYPAAQALAANLQALSNAQRAALDNVSQVLAHPTGDPNQDQARVAAAEAGVRAINAQLAALGVDVSGDAGGFINTPGATSPGKTKAIDATARGEVEDAVELWGSMDPMNVPKNEALAEEHRGTDPERYQSFGRFAPHFWVDIQKLVGDQPPPHGDPGDQDPPPTPPPGGGGGGGDPPKPPGPTEQEQRIAAIRAAAGQPAAANQIATPPTAAPTTEGIDKGDGTTDSAVHDGVPRIDGGQEDEENANIANPGGGAPGGGGEQGGGAPDGGGGGPAVAPPKPPVECPIGGKRKPEVVVEEYTNRNGQRRRRTYVDGREVSDILIEGGILSPTDADADGFPPPPESGNGEVTDGRSTKTYKDGRVVQQRLNSGGLLSRAGS